MEFLQKFLYFMLTDWLTDCCKHNSTMDKATGLISSLFDIASPQEVPFCQLQYVQHIMDLALSSFVLQFFSLTTQGVDLQ